MQRLLLTCLCAGAFIAVARADDEKDKKQEKSPGEALKAIMTEAVKEFRAAKKDDEKQTVLKGAATKLLELAEKNPKDPAALRAILTIVAGMPLQDSSKDGPKAKAIAILKKDYAKSEELAGAIPQLAMSDSPDVADFLKFVADQNTDKKVRLEAVKAVLSVTEGLMANSKDAAKEAAYAKDMDKYRKLAATEFKGQVKDLFVGAKMPELTSKNLDDKDVKLSDYKGKVVVVDVWATWCGPCVAMIPHSTKLVERMKGKPFALVSISFDDKKETVTKFIEKTPMPWDQWFNGRDGMIGKELEIKFFPTIYVVDGKGVIRFKNVRNEKLDAAVEKLVKEAEDGTKAKTE
jgi:thiol-disulfide isomerase/thioredoxin